MRSKVNISLAANYVLGVGFREASYLLMGTEAANYIVLPSMLATTGLNFICEVWNGNLKEKGFKGALEDSIVNGCLGFGGGEFSGMMIDATVPHFLERMSDVAQGVAQSFPVMAPFSIGSAKAVGVEGPGVASSIGARLGGIWNSIPQMIGGFTRPAFKATVPVQTFVNA